MAHGETDSLGSNPVLRRLKDDEAAFANRNMVKALEDNGSIVPGNTLDLLDPRSGAC